MINWPTCFSYFKSAISLLHWHLGHRGYENSRCGTGSWLGGVILQKVVENKTFGRDKIYRNNTIVGKYINNWDYKSRQQSWSGLFANKIDSVELVWIWINLAFILYPSFVRLLITCVPIPWAAPVLFRRLFIEHMLDLTTEGTVNSLFVVLSFCRQWWHNALSYYMPILNG